jgi:hypothetical protein
VGAAGFEPAASSVSGLLGTLVGKCDGG